MAYESGQVLSLQGSEKIWRAPVLTDELESSYLPNRFVFLNWDILQGYFSELENRTVENEGQFERWLRDLSEIEDQLHDAYQHQFVLDSLSPEEKVTALFERNLNNYEIVWENARQRLYERMCEMPWLYVSGQVDRRRLEAVISNRARNFSWAGYSLDNEDARIVSSIQAQDDRIDLEACDRLGDSFSEKKGWLHRTALLQESKNDLDLSIARLIEVRAEKASLHGHENYVAYRLAAQDSLDHSASDLVRAGELVLEHFGPLAEKCLMSRGELAGIKRFRPWHDNRMPQIPYSAQLNQPTILEHKLREHLYQLYPPFGEQFDRNRDRLVLDVYEREGKEPDAFLSSYARMGRYFLSTSLDGGGLSLSDLFHETSHFMEMVIAADRHPYYYYQQHPPELSEGIAMGLELIATDFYEQFYNRNSVAAAQRHLREEILLLLTENARNTVFESWLYTSGSGDYGTKWGELAGRAAPGINWSGYEEFRQIEYLDNLDLMCSPFDSANYLIGGLVAFEIYRNYRCDPQTTCAQIYDAMQLADSLPLRELYARAGVSFFTESDSLVDLAGAVAALL